MGIRVTKTNRVAEYDGFSTIEEAASDLNCPEGLVVQIIKDESLGSFDKEILKYLISDDEFCIVEDEVMDIIREEYCKMYNFSCIRSIPKEFKETYPVLYKLARECIEEGCSENLIINSLKKCMT